MPLGDYLAGLAFFVATAGSVGLAAWLVLRKRLGHLRGAPGVVAFGVLATAGIVAVYLVPGIVGLLSRSATLLVALALALAAVRLPRHGEETTDPPPELPASGRGSTVLAGAGALTVAIVAALELVKRGAAPVANIDALTFHLPDIARWIQSGGYWQVDQFVPGLAHGNYPQNGDLLLMSTVLPWSNDAFVRFVGPAFFALTGVALYALACEVRASRATAVLGAAMLLAIPAVFQPALLQVMTDPVMLAAFSAGLLFLTRSFRNRRRSELVIAGIALGLAFGTKWYGVSSVAVVILVWLGASLLARRSIRSVGRDGAIVSGAVGLAGGFWLLRNLVESGNPLFPVKVAPLGITVFDAPADLIRERVGFSIADYLTDPAAWSAYILPDFASTLGLPALFLALALVVTAATALIDRRRGLKRWHAPVAGVTTAALLACAYAITPTSALGTLGMPRLTEANTRYAVPALIACVPLAASAMTRLRGGSLLAQLFVVTAILEALRHSTSTTALAVAGSAACLVTVAATWPREGLLKARRWPRAKAVQVTAVAALAIAAVVLGYFGQARYNDGRYAAIQPTFDLVLNSAPSGARIGLAGTWSSSGYSPVWPLFGPRLGNTVEYVGPLESELLQQYTTSSAFASALERKELDLLLIGRGDPPAERVAEGRWAQEAGFEEVARDDRFTLYRAPRAAPAEGIR